MNVAFNDWFNESALGYSRADIVTNTFEKGDIATVKIMLQSAFEAGQLAADMPDYTIVVVDMANL